MKLVETVEKVKKGDTEAFTALVEQYQNLVLGYAFSILKDFQRAQDATQEAFIVAYYQISQLQNPELFPAWLKGIAHHQCHRQLRGKMKSWDTVESYDEKRSEDLGPDQLLSKKEQNLVILDAINSLPERQREVISLFYIEENSQQEVAKFLEMSSSDVNNCLHAARKTLRKKMDGIIDDAFKMNALTKDFADEIGRIIKIKGRLVDVEFDSYFKPLLFDDLSTGKKNESKLTIVQRLRDGHVRCLVTSDLNDLKSDQKIRNQNFKSIKSVDLETTKEVIASIGTKAKENREIFETGIKIIDLLCPFPKHGNIGLLGNTGTGRSALVAEMYRNFENIAGSISIFFFVKPSEAASVSKMIEQEPDLKTDESESLKTAWLISDLAADLDFARSFDFLEASIFFSKTLADQKKFPAIDPVHSKSQLLDASIVGKEHFNTALRVLKLFKNKKELNELDSSRFKKLKNYFTQPFFVMADNTKVQGVSVKLEDTINTCNKILNGELDSVPEKEFLYRGGIV